MQSGPTGGPDEVVCASRGVLIAPDANGHPKIALGVHMAAAAGSDMMGSLDNNVADADVWASVVPG